MPSVVIAGVGYAGLATARLFRAAGWDVAGITQSAESASRLSGEGIRGLACDISQGAAVDALAIHAPDAVIHCASSGRGGPDAYRAVYLDGCRNLMEAMTPRRFLFTSSTSVYAQTDGGIVDEKSPANPAGETGRILRDAEESVLQKGGIVARLAGIYGPGRSVLLRKFFAGEAVIEGDGMRVVNQAHRDDIAAALVAMIEHGEPGIYNVCDDAPMAQREVYAWLAGHFTLPLPPTGPVDPNRKRGWTSKRVSNAKLRALGWQPRWPSFFDAVRGEPELVALARPERG